MSADSYDTTVRIRGDPDEQVDYVQLHDNTQTRLGPDIPIYRDGFDWSARLDWRSDLSKRLGARSVAVNEGIVVAEGTLDAVRSEGGDARIDVTAPY